MIDIAILRENPEASKRKYDVRNFNMIVCIWLMKLMHWIKEYREALTKASELRAMRNSLSKEIWTIYA